MGNKQITDHLGNTFTSIKAMCEFHGVKYSTTVSRMGRCGSIEKCLYKGNLLLKDLKQGRKITVNGKCFNSAAQLARVYGVYANTLRNRLTQGITDKHLATKGYTTVDDGTHTDPYGKVYATRQAMCNAMGINIQSWSSYVNRHKKKGLTPNIKIFMAKYKPR